MTTYIDTADAAKTIRHQLREKLGLKARDTSVRIHRYSLGSAIRVEIRLPRVMARAVREIASEQERIHRCEATGEILGGGNRFVDVSYSREALDALAANVRPMLDKALAAARPIDPHLNRIEGMPGWLLGNGPWAGYLQAIAPDGTRWSCDPRSELQIACWARGVATWEARD